MFIHAPLSAMGPYSIFPSNLESLVIKYLTHRIHGMKLKISKLFEIIQIDLNQY